MFDAATRNSITDMLGSDVDEVRLVAKDELTITYELGLADGRQVLLRIPSFSENSSIVEAEIATLRYLADRTSIPVPSVLAFHRASDGDQSTTCYALLQKPSGTCVESLFPSMTPFEQNMIIAAIARWMVELFQHRFEAIGSLRVDAPNGQRIGPVVMKPFYTDGRSKLSLDRGPFNSAREYYRACAQRELDSSRMLFVQDAPPSYQHELEESRLMVERIAGLLCDLTTRCEGLDDDDPEMAPFSLDIHEIGLKNIFVSPDNPTNILCVTDWQYTNTHPLWCCARMPPWLLPSLTATNGDSTRLAAIFKAEVVRVAGINSTFLRSLDFEDTRSTLHDLSTYDAFRDGFLLLPARIHWIISLATLPGHEDVAGLTALLDPSTLPGRVARITLLTRGPNAMYLAMTPPRSPLMTSVKDESTDKEMASDLSVLVS
ncbi:hypothetical protein L226DRAFT_535046 [Lentinus tigrinus ALCF2SS1-7]|uniref:Aminoglycoside phosphotransferase domain-containing protein n=1 Tax=Lentinus tigrinus ALCF2SS1-6 TaxID=1328759 RepID=A0A5C2S8G6_9APHY|nr:hypothetical protein L227DRAFT_575644 [Lentinus tigrinus ALCF2SS1-6]RPD74825.1 hypothetical protein L226DRAFT_535046 [Lentinus tigrinus ALCF2SS1-7]